MSLDKNNSLSSGDLIEVKIKTPAIHQNDEKTGAVIIDICWVCYFEKYPVIATTQPITIM